MLKRLRVIVTFLVIGAITTVLVAWGCALYCEKPKFVGMPDQVWPLAVADDWADVPREMFRGETSGYRLLVAQHNPPREIPGEPGRYRLYTLQRVEIHDFGWPLPSMRSVELFTPERTTYRHALYAPLLDPVAAGSGRRLPLRPLWPGFLVETLLFAAIAWIVLDGHGYFRRVSRALKGRCPLCGYDLRGNRTGRCPECGV